MKLKKLSKTLKEDNKTKTIDLAKMAGSFNKDDLKFLINGTNKSYNKYEINNLNEREINLDELNNPINREPNDLDFLLEKVSLESRIPEINLDNISEKKDKKNNFKEYIKGLYFETDLEERSKGQLKIIKWYKSKIGGIGYKNKRIREYSLIQDDENFPTMVFGEIYINQKNINQKTNKENDVLYFDLNSNGFLEGTALSNRDISKTIDELIRLNKEDFYKEALKRKTSFLLFSNRGFGNNDLSKKEKWKNHIKQGKLNKLGVYTIKGNEGDFLITINNNERWGLEDKELIEIYAHFEAVERRMIEDPKFYVRGFDNYRIILKNIKEILEKRGDVPYSIGIFRPGGLYSK